MSITNSEGEKALRLFAHGDISVFKEQDATNTLLANDTNRNFVTEELVHDEGTKSVYVANRRTGGLEEHAEIAPTLLAFMGTGGGNVPIYKETLVRRLTPVECERLQGFPDGWTDTNTDTHRYRQMGNAVAVPVVQWIIGGIVSVHQKLGKYAE